MYSQSPNVGISDEEEPQATSSIESSVHFIIFAASLATLPYSVAVLWHICQGPSISLPKHHNLMLKGSLAPFLILRSLHALPPLWFAYSTRACASAGPLVPRLTAYITFALAFFAQEQNSWMPTSLGSVVFHARSRRLGRSASGPIESSHLKPETKLPPGYRIIGVFRPLTRSRTSVRNPSLSAEG